MTNRARRHRAMTDREGPSKEGNEKMSDASMPHCERCGQPEYACNCESVASNVVRIPYVVAPRQWINHLIQRGYIDPRRKHDADYVEEVINKLRRRSKEGFENARSR